MSSSVPDCPFEALLARSHGKRRTLTAPERTRVLLQRCFNLPLPYPVVKVAGTNGKGSVCAMLAACLGAEGWTPGTFTSPHLSTVDERIAVSGLQAARADLREAAVAIADRVDRTVAELGDDYEPTYFEAVLLTALQQFGNRGVKVAVLEAGIGGAYDAVSAVPGVLGVISGVALDHMEQLGGTEAHIARDKAGIADPRSSLVVAAAVSADARAAIEQEARRRSIRVTYAEPGRIRNAHHELTGTTAEVMHRGVWRAVRLALPGRYQLGNVETMLGALDALHDVLPVGARALRGLETVTWPGRFESAGNAPCWLLDVAHNPQAMRAFRQALDDVLPHGDRVLLCGVSKEHESEALVSELRSLAPRTYVADGFYQAAPAARIAERFGTSAEVLGDVTRAVSVLADRYSQSPVTIIVTGSLYLVGAVRPMLMTP